MDFIAYDPGTLMYWFIGLAALGFIVAIIGGAFGNGWLVVGGFCGFLAGLLCGFLVPTPVDHWSKDVRAEIKDHYGVTLSEKQFAKLKYPEQKEEPEGDFEQYGSVTVVKPDGDGSFEKTDVYLLWSDGEMILASPDEQKKLQPLKARD